MITSFVPVFESKYLKMRQDLKEELKRAKSDRRKSWIKNMIVEMKSLRNTLRECKKTDAKCCPHCGENL